MNKFKPKSKETKQKPKMIWSNNSNLENQQVNQK